ncbi:CDP-alcohol phosphatidyltransferase family protein [Haloplanus litoreus]|uniref:CDP-alcohol phosphatidyltransferase family protein n=1 Tax=Haloplanus litoreus TaxID=767515 RepID=UPI00360807DC
MQPRFVGRLGLADAVTVGNAMLGFLAAFVATANAPLAARIVLLAAVADGLDGVIARKRGGTAAGPYLDSLADVASFGVAPAMLIASRAADAWTLDGQPLFYVLGLLLPAVYVAMAVTRLGLYTAYDSDASETKGAPRRSPRRSSRRASSPASSGPSCWSRSRACWRRSW